MAEENKNVVETPVEPTTENKPEETKIDPKELKNQILRDLSKELGVNVFEAEGLAKVKELIDSQKTEQEKLQEKLNAYEEEKASWQTSKLEYEAKIEANKLGINSKYLDDALKLANNDPSKLAEIVEKYPMFKEGKKITIGKTDPVNQTPPDDKSEALAYMANNPLYRGYLKKK